MRFAHALAALLLAIACQAHAGRACNDTPVSAESARRGMQLALQTRNALDASGAEVALVARVGRDLSRYGLRYSHLGIAWRDHPAGRWFVVHELNTCGTATSDLHDEGLGNFFLDDLHAWEAAVTFVTPETGTRLAGLLAGRTPLFLHEPHYNLAAYAFSTRYQNSNQWVLEVLAAAMAPPGSVASRAAAQAWLRDAGFSPITLAIGPMERLGGRMFRANIAFDDHPPERRFAGRIDAVSVESVQRFVAAREPAARSVTITLRQ